MGYDDKAGQANNATTALGFWDTAKQAKAADQLFDMTEGASRSELFAKTGEFGFPGSRMLNFVGGALSTLGLGMDVIDMIQNGVGVENSISASGNAAGVVSAIAGATPLGAATAGWSVGTAVGQAGISDARDNGYLGQTNTEYESAGNRGWDDVAADWGRSTRDSVGDTLDDYVGDTIGHGLGYVAGLAATGAGSVVGAIGATGSAVASAGRAIFGLDHTLLEGVGGTIARARRRASSEGS